MFSFSRYYIGVVYRSNITENFSSIVSPVYSPISDKHNKMPYLFYGYTRSCLFWDSVLQIWSNEGCYVSNCGVQSRRCLWTHLLMCPNFVEFSLLIFSTMLFAFERQFDIYHLCSKWLVQACSLTYWRSSVEGKFLDISRFLFSCKNFGMYGISHM